MINPGPSKDNPGRGISQYHSELIAAGQNLPDLKIDTLWVHMLRSMFTKGMAKQIGPTPFFVYSAIKAHCNLETGNAFPSHETLIELTGFSKATVIRAIATLLEFKLLEINKQGRKNHYALVEHFPITLDDKVVGGATGPYIPKQMQHLVEEVKLAVKTGIDSPDKQINVTVNLYVQHNETGDHATIIQGTDIHQQITHPPKP